MVAISRLKIKGFGRFSNTSIELSPGLNVIFGGNEAGKSTLHRFIESILFGFWEPNFNHPQKEEYWARYKPWDNSNYGGELIYQWSQGSVLVRRNFTDNTVEVMDALSGQPITDIPVNSWGEPDLAKAHWGCSKLVFRNTISISQLGAATDSALVGEVKRIITNLAQSGGSGISVDHALSVLAASNEGLEGRVYQAREQWQQLSEQLESSRRLHKEARQLELEKLRLSQQLEATSLDHQEEQKRREQGRAIIARRRLNHIEEYQSKKQELEQQLPGLSLAKAVDQGDLSRLSTLGSDLKSAQEIMAGHLATELETERLHRQAMEKMQELQVFDQFEKDSTVEVSSACKLLETHRATVAQLRDQLGKTTQQTKEVASQLSQLPYFRPDVFEQAASLHEQAQGSQIQGSQQELTDGLRKMERSISIRRFLRGAMIVSLPAVGVAAWYFSSYLAALALLPLATIALLNGEINKLNRGCRDLRKEIYALDMEYHNSQRQREQAQRNLGGLLEKYDSRDIQDLGDRHKRFSELTDKNRELMQEQKYLRGKLEQHEQEVREQQQKIESIFSQAGLETEDMEQGLQMFRSGMEQLQQASLVVEQRQQQLDSIREKLEQSRQNLAGLEKQIQGLLSSYGADSIQQLGKMAENMIRRQQLQKDIADTEGQISQLLEGVSLDQLRKQAAAAADLPEDFQVETGDADQTQHLQQLQQRVSQIEGRLEGIYSNLKPITEIEEAANVARKAYSELQQQAEALEAASVAISKTANQLRDQLAPDLNQRVSGMVETISGGRYKKLNVATDMSVTVIPPEHNKPVSLDKLSGGTIDQIYFACRVAIADLVTGQTLLPLLLDDSFVQYDDQRLERMLLLLNEMSKSRQVLLFTCQQRELDALARLAPETHNLVRLD
jgi:uncharacterized protein YhaN